jgi:hypothetical protein
VFRRYPFLVLGLVFVGYSVLVCLGLNLYFRKDETDKLKRYLKDNTQALANWEQNTPLEKILKLNGRSLYLFTKKGEAVLRHLPINAPFGSVDTDYLKNFFVPKPFVTAANERWYLAAKPLIKEGQQIATIAIGKKINNPGEEEVMEKFLFDSLGKISLSLTVTQDKISLPENLPEYTNLDGVLLADQFGEILFQKGTFPYQTSLFHLQNYLESATSTININKTRYLVSSEPIGNFLLIAAQKLPSLSLQLERTLKLAAVTSLLFTFGVIIVFRPFTNKSHTLSSPVPISFDAKTGILKQGEKALTLPLDTNQYYLFSTLFKNKGKWLELDQITDVLFGKEENPGDFKRPVYDAARLTNKKTKETFGLELIEIGNSRYRLNAQFLSDSQ